MVSQASAPCGGRHPRAPAATGKIPVQVVEAQVRVVEAQVRLAVPRRGPRYCRPAMWLVKAGWDHPRRVGHGGNWLGGLGAGVTGM